MIQIPIPAKIDFLTVLEWIPGTCNRFQNRISMIPIPIPAKKGIITPLVCRLSANYCESLQGFRKRRKEKGERPRAIRRREMVTFFTAKVRSRERRIRELPYMTSAKFSDFLTPSPLSAFGSALRYRIHATSLTTSAFEVTPSQCRRHMYMPLYRYPKESM